MIFIVDKKDLNWIKELIESVGCHINKKEWRNKNQSYVRYDYEPFDFQFTSDYEIILYVDGSSQKLKFLQHLIDGRKSCNWFFDLCLQSS